MLKVAINKLIQNYEEDASEQLSLGHKDEAIFALTKVTALLEALVLYNTFEKARTGTEKEI